VLPGTVTRPTVRACYLAVSGPVAASVFVIGTVVASLTWRGYDHGVQPLSDLGGTAAPAPVIQNLTFVLFGVAVVTLGVGLWAARLRRGVAVLVGVFGAAMAALSVLTLALIAVADSFWPVIQFGSTAGHHRAPTVGLSDGEAAAYAAFRADKVKKDPKIKKLSR
jgi:Na+/H+-translocating membrane pyrophosphatase